MTDDDGGMAGVERRRLADLIEFDPGRMAKHRLFETDRTMTDVYCLEPGQEQLVHVHEASDKVLVVMAGRVLARVGDEYEELAQYEAVLAPAGEAHALKNLGPDPAVLLVFVGPRLR
jgi:quercetin dioxygenase-like cupin family protein